MTCFKRLLLLTALVFAAGGVLFLLYSRTQETYRGYGTPEQYVDIPQGAGTKAIGQRLRAREDA